MPRPPRSTPSSSSWRTYDGGIESAAVWQLRDYVYARKDDAAGRAECEAKLLAFLKSPASPAARTVASRHLQLIAGDTAVPALQAMLTDDKLADLALYALQGIAGATAERALVQSLGVATGATKIEIVAALGERRSVEAVPAIVPLLQQPALTGPAAIALGRIGGEAAVSALGSAYGGTAGALRATIAGALLEAVSGFEFGNQKLPIYERIASDTTLPEAQRRAALIGRIHSTDPRQAVIAMLTSQDPLAQEAAIACTPFAFFPDTIGKVCAALPGLSDVAKVQLIAALAGYAHSEVAAAVTNELGSPTPAVRVAAFKTLGAVGGAAAVRPLAEAAARAKGPEQAAARAAIGSLKGQAVDEEIVAQLGRKPADDLAGELLLAVGDRRVFSAKPVVTAALGSSTPALRGQALRALRGIGTPSDMPAVLDLLLGGSGESDRTEAERTMVALAQKIDNLDGRSSTREIAARFGEAFRRPRAGSSACSRSSATRARCRSCGPSRPTTAPTFAMRRCGPWRRGRRRPRARTCCAWRARRGTRRTGCS